MIKISNVKIPYRENEKNYIKYISRKIRTAPVDILEYKLLKRSLDARRKERIGYVCTFTAIVKNEDELLSGKISDISLYNEVKYSFPYNDIRAEKNVIIIGSGPSGLFCALMLARAGMKPTVIERGEMVDERKKTVESFWNGEELNVNSNVQFGEGGAGTFSDGKLTCGLNDIRMNFVTNEFVNHGAPEDIITNAKPHIGTDFLTKTVSGIRDEIISLGGDFIFNTVVNSVKSENGRITSVTAENVKSKETFEKLCDICVLAIGHSSRDTYEMLLKSGFKMERKPFSVGVRIEHRREYINKIQYGKAFSDECLPAADYKLSCHIENGNAYTFCMCPGGKVVAGASEENRVVTNGMSNFKRDDVNSNSAILVGIAPDDIEGDDVFGGMKLQRKLEEDAFDLGGKNYFAPCQTVKDFLNGTESTGCGEVQPSYKPGVTYTDIGKILPDKVCATLKDALLQFEDKMKGFALDDAVLTGVETRSSSPIRIVRDESFQSNIASVYPIGEGAGYAGGIMSSAVDGIKCAEKIIENII